MKNIFAIIMAMILLVTTTTTQTYAMEMGNSTIEYTVPSTYIIEIPQTIEVGQTISFNSYLNIAPTQEVIVSLTNDSFNIDGHITLIHDTYSDKTIYVDFYTENGCVTVDNPRVAVFTDTSSISSEFWVEYLNGSEEKAGHYTGNVTFFIECVNK